MKTTFLLSAFSVFLLLGACKPAQKIAYNTQHIQQYQEASGLSLSVQSFEDIRSQSEINQTHLAAKDIIAKINEETDCINAEKLYKIPVGTQMADIFAKHLSGKMYFSNVLVDQKADTDYYITAKLKHFYGAQKRSTKAAVGASFGLIGALATSGLKTDGKIIIELTDICVYSKENKLIAKVGDFKKEYTGEFPVDAYCYCIYQNINQKLMEFNEELCQAIYREVKNEQAQK